MYLKLPIIHIIAAYTDTHGLNEKFPSVLIMLSQELLSNKIPNIKLEAIPSRCCWLRMSKKYLNPSRLLLFPLVVS